MEALDQIGKRHKVSEKCDVASKYLQEVFEEKTDGKGLRGFLPALVHQIFVSSDSKR